MKRKRNVVWRECRWCAKRNVEVKRFGKLKTLHKHEVECEAKYRKEFCTEVKTLPSIETMMQMMQDMQKQIHELQVEVKTLKEHKHKERVTLNPYLRITPRKCWEIRKDNVIRALDACATCFTPGKYYKTVEDYFEFQLISQATEVEDILSLALWPILEQTKDDKICLKRIETTDVYSLCKQIWGKTFSTRNSLLFYKEALQEYGLDMDRFFDESKFLSMCEDFDRWIGSFQETGSRSNGNGVCWGMNGMLRLWKKIYILPEQFLKACNSRVPLERLSLESV